jgi:rhamnose transport system permease protein
MGPSFRWDDICGWGEHRGTPMTDQAPNRNIPDRLDSPLRAAVFSWQTLLLVVAIVIFTVNSFASPYFLSPWSLSDATFNFTEKALIALAMALLIIAGEIDLSVAAIIALASTAMGFALQFGADTPVLVAIGIATGLACGAFNGFLVTRLGLPSIVVTIGTMSLFRGISFIVLGDQAFKGYPASFAFFGQGYVWWVVSFEFVLFLVMAVVYFVILHRTSFGRRIFVIGNNATAAQFSGVRVERIKFMLFCLTGLMSGVAAVLLTSRLGSTRPSIAQGWELEVITMVVLGGVSILGGAGSIIGVVIAAFIIGLVTFGMGLLNVPGIVQSIFIGLLLITVIALPIVVGKLRGTA